MTEQELLLDCLARLNGSDIEYFLTGSMASNYWGVPRSTHDLDFVVQLRTEVVPKLVQAFSSNFFIQETSAQAALSPPFQFNAIDQRSALKVDFWVLTNDPFSQAMFARRRSVMLFGLRAWIASAEDIILHKLWWNAAAPSERQVRDAAGVWSVQGDALDLQYMDRWALDLKIDAVLAKIRSGEILPKTT